MHILKDELSSLLYSCKKLTVFYNLFSEIHIHSMTVSLIDFLKSRAKAQNITLIHLCQLAGISRQTFYSLGKLDNRMPELHTLVRLAMAVNVHPMQLLQLVINSLDLNWKTKTHYISGDRSGFVQDVTIPDGSLVAPGQTFTKTWEVQNLGNVPWIGRVLRCADAQLVVHRVLDDGTQQQLEIALPLLPKVQHIAVPDTLPGETVRLSVDFTAPTQPGGYVSYWKSYFDDGSLCFPDVHGLSCYIQVQGIVASAFVERRQGDRGAGPSFNPRA